MTPKLIVNGITLNLSPQECKAAVMAVLKVKGKTLRWLRDMMAYKLYESGRTYAEIGKALGISTRAVKGALTRVENGRYG